MKKQGFYLLGLLIICYSVTSAQIRVGIMGGPQSSSVKESNNLPGWNDIKDNYKSRLGFHAGFVADIPFSPTSKLYFQPGLQYSTKGRKYSESFDTTGGGLISHLDSTQYINYIEAPLNLVLKFPLGKKVKFVIGAGPYVAFFLSGKESYEYLFANGDFVSDELKDLPVGKGPGKYRTLDFGVNGLAGFEIGRVFLTANYSQGLTSFYEPANYTGTAKHQVIGGTLGIFLGKQPKVEPVVKDKDKDGVPDKEDACPTEAGTAATKGCPDKDADGVADKDDKCPDQKGLLKYNGCPVPDTDGDGVNDEEDKCKTEAGSAKYAGCPVPDTDKDGINDDDDKCKTVAGVEKYGGCPVPDTDKDGVSDEEDKCPQTAGPKENNGCPVIKKEIVEKINYAARRIQFEFAKSTIKKESHKQLDEVIKILNQDASLVLSIEGHTSNDGVYEANMKLSQERANNVKAYFISKGIDANRLISEGFGPNKPLNKGKTDAEKAANRRVELKLSNR